MPLIRTNDDVMTMLLRLQKQVPNPADLDGSTGEGVYETLLWLTGDRSDDDLAVHFEE